MDAAGIALVTGASRGIGRAVALELARRGFEVVATMRRPEAGDSLQREAAREGLRIGVERLDLDDPDQFHPPAGLRVLVNNAGIEEAYLPVELTPAEQWRRIFQTNVFGLVQITQRAIPELRLHGGVICNVTSSSLIVPTPFYAAYRASKAAVSALGETLRVELAPFGVRVLEVLPGPIDTDMLAGSDRPLEAASHPAYRAMAERSYENRKGAGALVTAPADAAKTIAEAILNDAAPLRVGCDPMSAQMLDAWRQTSDEDWMRSMLSALWGIDHEAEG
jgi:NAD(P)-dependent dehydrogenase (short-subunit alcohol dehydrogenase family)